MNFRTTTLLFGLLLLVLWAFGLMVAIRKSAIDEGMVMPKFGKEGSGVTVTQVEITKEGKKYTFTKGERGWKLKGPGSDQEVRADDKRVEDLIEEVRSARHSPDETDVTRRDLERWNLNSPEIVVTLKDTGSGAEATFNVGKKSESGDFAYVNSSDRPREALAVKVASIPSVFFDSIDKYRSRSLLGASEDTAKKIDIQEVKDGKLTTVLALKQTKKDRWVLVKPALGPAEVEGNPAGKLEHSVRGLLATINALRAEEFEPLGGTTTLDEKGAKYRIEIESEVGKGIGKKDKDKPGKVEKDALLIGEAVRNSDPKTYLARLASDPPTSVVRVSAKVLEPILELLKDPTPLRSHDLSQFDEDAVDYIEITRGKETIKLAKRHAGWKVYSGDSPGRDASPGAVDNVIAGLRGKHEIGDKDFSDVSTAAKVKELEARFAPEKVEARIKIYTDSLEPEPKKDDKDKKKDDKDKKKDDQPKKDTGKDTSKETSKDTSKDTGKDTGKDTSKDTGKKDEGKKDEGKKDEGKKDVHKEDTVPPKFKEGAKEAVLLSFVSLSKDKVLVKREVPDSEPIYFEMSTNAFERAAPPDMALAFYKTEIPSFTYPEAAKLELLRTDATSKTPEKFVLDREPVKDEDAKYVGRGLGVALGKGGEWKLTEPRDQAAGSEVDTLEVIKVLRPFSAPGFRAERWVRQLAKDEKVRKEQLGEFGLDAPSAVLIITYDKKKETEKKDLDAKDPLKKDAGKKDEGKKDAKEETEKKTIKILLGRESRETKDKEGVYAMEEGTDLVFLVPASTAKVVKEAEFRDRQVIKIDPTQVISLQCYILDKEEKEIRDPLFERNPDKTWKVARGTTIKLDSNRVDELVRKIAELKVVRYLNAKLPADKGWRLEGDLVPLKFVLEVDDGKTKEKHTFIIGAESEKNGPYYATYDKRPGVIFLVPRSQFEGVMNGKVGWFAK
jgi:hypothetical protein